MMMMMIMTRCDMHNKPEHSHKGDFSQSGLPYLGPEPQSSSGSVWHTEASLFEDTIIFSEMFLNVRLAFREIHKPVCGKMLHIKMFKNPPKMPCIRINCSL